MNTSRPSAPVILACVIGCTIICGCIVAFGLLKPDPAADPELEAGIQSELGRLRQDLADRDRTLEKIQSELAQLRAAPAATPASRGLTEAEVRRIVAEAVTNRGEIAASVAEEVEEAEAGAFDLGRELSGMIAQEFDWDERQKVWAKIKEKGQFKEAIAWFKQRAKDLPNDPEAHADLADAYLALINSGTVGYMEMGPISAAADKSLDRALELDDHHWRSRFNKAMSYSFWPDAMGKKPAAIQHFEILAGQQSKVAPEPQHAMTHLFLGNLYAQRGEMDKARQNWSRGLEIDPDNADLKKQIASHPPAGN